MNEKIEDILLRLFPLYKSSYRNSLISSGVIDSFGLFLLIDELSDIFSIDIPMDFISLENFDSIDSIVKLIKELQR